LSYPNGLRRLPRPFVISSQAALAASHSRAMRRHARVIVGFFRVFDRVALPQPSEAGSHQRIVPDALSGALRSDPRIGAANSKVLGLPALNHAFEPSLFEPKSSVAGKRNFQGRDRGAETASKGQGRRCRDKIELKNGANSGLVSEN
jgi:hypothetical protein